jgi:hypothetical protein
MISKLPALKAAPVNGNQWQNAVRCPMCYIRTIK